MKNKISKILGWFYIALGWAFNPWVLAARLAPDGRIESVHLKVLICLFDVLLIVFGILTLKRIKPELIANINLSLWTLVIATPLLGEMMFQTGIALGLKKFKSPALYADGSSEDDYWKLEEK